VPLLLLRIEAGTSSVVCRLELGRPLDRQGRSAFCILM
jgi:hypothetical protein